jgi:hypothetical protein
MVTRSKNLGESATGILERPDRDQQKVQRHDVTLAQPKIH